MGKSELFFYDEIIILFHDRVYGASEYLNLVQPML